MKAYKLTDENNRTRNQTQWGCGATHETNGHGHLCGAGFLHFYRHPLIAVLMNPIHGNFDHPRLWEAHASGTFEHEDLLKSGCTKLTTLREIPLPRVTTTQRVRFAILCALEVCKKRAFVAWAKLWLSGKDRSDDAAAEAAAGVSGELGAMRAADAAGWLVSAARATSTESQEARAGWAAWSAAMAAGAANKEKPLDLIALALKAVEQD